MQTDSAIFLRCFIATALFALALLALVYFSIPPLQHAVRPRRRGRRPPPGAAAMSVRACSAPPADMLRAGAGLLLLCLAGAVYPFRRLRARRRELALLRAELTRTLAVRNQTTEESSQHGAALDAVLPLAAELTERPRRAGAARGARRRARPRGVRGGRRAARRRPPIARRLRDARRHARKAGGNCARACSAGCGACIGSSARRSPRPAFGDGGGRRAAEAAGPQHRPRRLARGGKLGADGARRRGEGAGR
ncbi:MAG: hypothetical protein WDN72_03440 [Alphaproteobacteria bacterium]